jgi:hypothetical protein
LVVPASNIAAAETVLVQHHLASCAENNFALQGYRSVFVSVGRRCRKDWGSLIEYVLAGHGPGTQVVGLYFS